MLKSKFTKSTLIGSLALSAAAFTFPVQAEVMVGGAPMLPSKDIVDNAVNSKDHTTLVAAVKAAGLVDTLKGKGPFTVFAPTNNAFVRLTSATSPCSGPGRCASVSASQPLRATGS